MTFYLYTINSEPSMTSCHLKQVCYTRSRLGYNNNKYFIISVVLRIYALSFRETNVSKEVVVVVLIEIMVCKEFS